MIFCGSRDWTGLPLPVLLISMVIPDRLPGPYVCVHGGATGADRICAQVSATNGWAVEEHKPDYAAHGGLRAPHVRNDLMLSLGAALVVCLWNGWSKGTRSMMNKAPLKGIPCATFMADGPAYTIDLARLEIEAALTRSGLDTTPSG